MSSGRTTTSRTRSGRTRYGTVPNIRRRSRFRSWNRRRLMKRVVACLAASLLASAAKVPLILTNAGTSVVTTRSPYIARFSFTIWQSCVPLGEWAAKKFKRAYTLVSDYAPGHDAETAFTQGFKAGGGEIVGAVRVPLQNPDFAPYLQRVKDAKPDALMVFIPAGKTSTSVMKAFSDLGLAAAGTRRIGPGDIPTDEELPNRGDVALGVTTAHHSSGAAERPANRRFVEAWKKEYGAASTPNFAAVAAWDAMDAIFQVVRAHKGNISPGRTMEVLNAYPHAHTPRGPTAIHPQPRY